MRTTARRFLVWLLNRMARAAAPPTHDGLPTPRQLAGELRRQEGLTRGRPDLEPLRERLRGLRERLEHAQLELGSAGGELEYRRLAVGVMALCRQVSNLIRDGPDPDRLGAAAASAQALHIQAGILARGLRTR